MTSTTSTPNDHLLSAEERAFCENLRESANSDVSKRAIALLMLDEGATQANVADRSELSVGQVRYLVKRFKEKRLGIFPSSEFPITPTDIVTVESPALVEEKSAAARPLTSAPGTRQTAQGGHRAPNRAKTKKRPKRPKPPKKKKKSKRKRRKQ